MPTLDHLWLHFTQMGDPDEVPVIVRGDGCHLEDSNGKRYLDALARVFFVSGGSEAVEAAWKLARQYHSARGERRWKAVARRVSYHGTTMGALSINGCTDLRTPFEPLVPDGSEEHTSELQSRET